MNKPENVTIRYNGCYITLNTDKEEWGITDNMDHFLGWRKSLKAAKKTVDQFLMPTSKPFAAIYQSWNGSPIQQVVVTSFSEGNDMAWIRHTNGQRERVDVGHLFADTPQNRATFERVMEMRREINKLDKQIEALVKGTEPIPQPRDLEQEADEKAVKRAQAVTK